MIKTILVGSTARSTPTARSQYALWLAERLQGCAGRRCTSSTSSRSRARSSTTSPARSASSRTSTSRRRCARCCRSAAACCSTRSARSATQRGVRADTVLAMGIVANEIASGRAPPTWWSSATAASTSGSRPGCSAARPRAYAEVPEAGVHRAARVPRDHAAAAGLRRRAARRAAMQRRPSSARALGLPLTVLHVARDEAPRATACSPRRSAISQSYDVAVHVRAAATGHAPRAHRRRSCATRLRPALHRRVRPPPHHRDGARQHHRVRAAQQRRPVFLAR